ncbi:circadian clock KaiB family protein [Methanothermobacter sp. K4]|uniref:circadian clock KaiB family protein n=1 Tax=Methanothermobacter sp. K4 TaxID=2913262 RepID=UPI001EDA41D5|nr:circadian clock KaiB family protein [Methanothermobacter sp. K4]MCG2828237.1 circadian clock KaiB family protein [Methanothermobacter sp. K4]
MVKLHLRLYVLGDNQLSDAALMNIRSLVGDEAVVEVIDVGEKPSLARENGVIAIPTLERLKPGPVRRVIGDLSDRNALMEFLGYPHLSENLK